MSSTNTNDLVGRLIDSMTPTELMRIAPLSEVARLRGMIDAASPAACPHASCNCRCAGRPSPRHDFD
jgi:hypothetical protein